MAVPAAEPVTIDRDTRIGAVRLIVNDMSRSRRFYEETLGLRAFERDDGTVAFGVEGNAPLVDLRADSDAPHRDRSATGLFHLAILLPSRRDLAHALGRLATTRWPLDGASDHLVSEALYLSDPDGNGIEIYRDRPTERWTRRGGQLEMSTLPLNLDDVARELDGQVGIEPRAPAGTTIGHVHLQVSDLAEAEAFYAGVLGFEVTARGYPGALFVSAGGYHHHIGLNVWNSRGSGPPPPGSVGLLNYEIVVPGADELERVVGRARAAGIAIGRFDGPAIVRDPAGNAIALRAGEQRPASTAAAA